TTDDLLRVVTPVQLAAQVLVLLVKVPVLEHAPDLAEHLVEQDRLHEVVVRAALERLDRVFDGREGGHQQYERLRAELEQPFEKLDAVDPGQLNVAQGDVVAPL